MPRKQHRQAGQSRGAKPPERTKKLPPDEFSLMTDRELLACLRITVDGERRAALLAAAQRRGLRTN